MPSPTQPRGLAIDPTFQVAAHIALQTAQHLKLGGTVREVNALLDRVDPAQQPAGAPPEGEAPRADLLQVLKRMARDHGHEAGPNVQTMLAVAVDALEPPAPELAAKAAPRPTRRPAP